MRLLLVALALAALAITTAPAIRATDDVDPSPWPPEAVRVAALGRHPAAADVAWLKTVQLLGSDAQATAHYPELEKWIDLVTGLDPGFQEPYFFGATLLVTDAERAPQIDVLLDRGERAFPELFHFAMLRGFLAQFGLLDPTKAAVHYRRAAAMEGAPPYLLTYADRLAREGVGCGGIMADLKQLASTSSSAQASALAQERGAILEHCLAGLIRSTAIQLRFNGKTQGAHATLAEVEASLGAAVPHPPDRCWQLASDNASLGPCPAPADRAAPEPQP